MSRVTVTIDRVTLHGMNAAERLALVDALVGSVRSELARALANPASNFNEAHSRHTPVVRIGPMTMEPGTAGARRLGAGIARGIAREVVQRNAQKPGKGVRS
jgi:hypothetical protein